MITIDFIKETIKNVDKDINVSVNIKELKNFELLIELSLPLTDLIVFNLKNGVNFETYIEQKLEEIMPINISYSLVYKYI